MADLSGSPASIFSLKSLLVVCCIDFNALQTTVLPAKSDSDVMFCLQSYPGLVIDRPLVY